jgi:hypothetical protein
MRAAYIAVLLACAPGAAAAQSWTLTTTASGSQADGDDSPFIGGASVSLERDFDANWLGASIGFTEGEATIPEVDASIDQQSVDASLWWGAELGEYDLTIALNYTRQDIDGGFVLGGTAFAADGETASAGVSLTLSRTFGDDSTLTPSVTISHSETDTDLVWSAGGPGIAISESASGLSGAVRLDGAAAMGEGASVLGGIAYIATDDAAAQTFAGSRGWTRQREDEGAADWGEAYIGLELELSQASVLSGSIGSTIGRDEEEAFGAISLSWSF